MRATQLARVAVANSHDVEVESRLDAGTVVAVAAFAAIVIHRFLLQTIWQLLLPEVR